MSIEWFGLASMRGSRRIVRVMVWRLGAVGGLRAADGVIRLWDACSDCENPDALMTLAKTRVTRELTRARR